jgi:hypothetical protein
MQHCMVIKTGLQLLFPELYPFPTNKIIKL